MGRGREGESERRGKEIKKKKWERRERVGEAEVGTES